MEQLDACIAAAKEGDLARVTRLLDDNPALANGANMFGSRAVHAAYFAGRKPVFEFLLSRGVPLDASLAAELGMLDRVEAAVNADASLVGSFSSAGTTLLHRACYWGQVTVAVFLLDQGADPDAVTRDAFLQIRPLGCAVATPDVPNPSDQEETVLELVLRLIDRGADVNGRRRDGLTALHSAAYRGHVGVMRYLLEHGADPEIRGHEGAGPHAGQSARDMALAQGQVEAAALLDTWRDSRKAKAR